MGLRGGFGVGRARPGQGNVQLHGEWSSILGKAVLQVLPCGKGVAWREGKKGLGVTFCSMLSLVINCVFRETLGGTWRGISCYRWASDQAESLVPKWMGHCCKS